MNAVKELQNRLSRIIYTISDVRFLRQIESAVDDLLPTKDLGLPLEEVPWNKAVLSMKPIQSFEEEVIIQGDKNLTFSELYPCIDDSDDEYDIHDLLAALN